MERRETDEKEIPTSEQRVYQVNPAVPPWKPWNHDSTADDTQLGSCKKSSCGLSVDVWCLRLGSWLRGKLGWYQIIASSRKQSTIALSSGDAELVAALSGACDGIGLRQQWNWLRQFGNTDDEETGRSQQILCCDSSAALGMIRRKGLIRETGHMELKAFLLQQWSARPEVRLVQVGTSEMLADCLTKIQSTPNSIHNSRSSDWKSNPVLNLFKLRRKDRAEEVCEKNHVFSTILLLLPYFLFPFSVRVDASHPRSFVLNMFVQF